MKILCATDFSVRARAAAEVAFDLARATSGSVELVHVVPPPATDVLALSTDAAVLEGQIRSDGATRLAAERQALAGRGDVPLTSWIDEGDIDGAIAARAQSGGADLIVLGANGRPALERFVLGSDAERTVRRADRPVLIVPSPAEGAGKGWGGTRPLRVVLALDGRLASEGALDFVRSLRRQIPFDVTVLRLYWSIEEFARLGLTGQRDLFAPDREVVADLTRTLSLEVGVLPGSGRVSFAVEPVWGDPASGILDFASAHEATLVVMGAESRRGLARIAHPPVAIRVARRARDIPVVFVPSSHRPGAPAEVPGIFTVLAPTDLSPEGNRAVPFAYALLAAHGGVVELCHVHERSLPAPAYAYDRPEGKLTEVERTRLEAELRALVPRDAERLGITTHVGVVDGGRAPEAILQAAERLGADSIVLGSHGRGGAYRSLLGLVSEDVVRHARRPVLVVPSPKKEAP